MVGEGRERKGKVVKDMGGYGNVGKEKVGESR